MSCVFRAYGATFNVDRFLSKASLRPCEVWHKGDLRPGGKGAALREHSGINVEVSDAGWDNLELQIRHAVRFLKKHRADLSRLAASSAVEFAFFDFGVRRREDALMQGAYLPPDLIQLAGSLKIGIKVSTYAIQDRS